MPKPYPVPDVLAPNLKLLICGTAPSRVSAHLVIPYGNPGNQFWPTLTKLGFLPSDFDRKDFREVHKHGLGLTNLAPTGIGNDDDLADDVFDPEGLTRKVRRHKPKWLAFNSKFTAETYLNRKLPYGLLPDLIGETKLFVLPSTSGRARRFFDERWWKELASYIEAVSPPSAPSRPPSAKASSGQRK